MLRPCFVIPAEAGIQAPAARPVLGGERSAH